MIRIDYCPIEQLVPLNLEHRRNAVQQRKKATYQFRNLLLSQLLDAEISEKDILKSEFGKPYLNRVNPISFNQSHSHNLYVLACSFQQQHLGVDVEDLARQVRFDAFAKHAFHPEEYEMWQALDQDRHFWFRVWTAKEAILKAHGMGIRLPLHSLNTQVHPVHTQGYVQHEELGSFAYQSFELEHSIVTTAWATGQGCGEFIVPTIQIHSHKKSPPK